MTVAAARARSTPNSFPDGALPAPESSARKLLIRGVALIALAETAVYLLWRLGGTIDPAWWWISIPLFFVEDRALALPTAVFIFVGASVMWGISGLFFGRLADRGWARPLIVFGGFGTGFAYLGFVLWGFVPGAVGFLLLYAFLWPAGGQVPLTFLGERLGTAAQRTELGLTENMYLAGDATGAALIGFLSGAWTLTWALALIPGAVTLLAGGLFAWQYGFRRAEQPPAPEGAA